MLKENKQEFVVSELVVGFGEQYTDHYVVQSTIDSMYSIFIEQNSMRCIFVFLSFVFLAAFISDHRYKLGIHNGTKVIMKYHFNFHPLILFLRKFVEAFKIKFNLTVFVLSCSLGI